MIQIKARLAENGCSLIKSRNAELDHFGSSLWASQCLFTDFVIETYCRMTTVAFRCLAVKRHCEAECRLIMVRLSVLVDFEQSKTGRILIGIVAIL